MVEPHDPVLINSDSSSSSSSLTVGSAWRYYSAQLGLRFKMQPHLFLSSSSSSSIGDQLELTCVSRLGLRQGNDAVIEGRAKWIVRLSIDGGDGGGIGGGQRQAATAQSNQIAPVDHKWQQAEDDDYDDDQQEGGVITTRRKGHDDDDVLAATRIRPGSSSSDSDDGTAQSPISDSENPSRRTQPVVGSHPGKKKQTKQTKSLSLTIISIHQMRCYLFLLAGLTLYLLYHYIIRFIILFY